MQVGQETNDPHVCSESLQRLFFEHKVCSVRVLIHFIGEKSTEWNYQWATACQKQFHLVQGASSRQEIWIRKSQSHNAHTLIF